MGQHIPGKRPASKKPSNTRIATRPSKVLINPIPIVEIPHNTIINESHVEGASFFKIIFDGTSKMMSRIE
jgi:hypothetical protein